MIPIKLKHTIHKIPKNIRRSKIFRNSMKSYNFYNQMATYNISYELKTKKFREKNC